jgi:arabinogalactan endo-1,4-beta-galactosidase
MRALQAVQDAAADISAGAAMPAPLTCIHITPAWDASDFFNLASSNGIQYDAICQSYYPLFHGPLTPAQASASNPNRQPVEQTVLNTAAANIGKPIFVIETGEHYENGFLSNDPWYPPSKANQAQFLRDLEAVLQNLPNHLAMGFAYWNPAGVDIPRIGGGLFNGGANQPDAVYVWNGLTIFDNADTSGSTNVTDPNYSTPLPALDALGGR